MTFRVSTRSNVPLMETSAGVQGTDRYWMQLNPSAMRQPALNQQPMAAADVVCRMALREDAVR